MWPAFQVPVSDICIVFLELWLVDCGLIELLLQWMRLPYLFYQSVLYLANWNEQSCLLVGYNISRVCGCRFPEWPLAHIYNTENVVPQEGEAVSLIPDGEFWRPCYVIVYKYFGLIMCVWCLSISVFTNKILHIFFVIVCSRSIGR